MSQSVPSREVARRVFAAEYNDASYTFKESDDERAPLYLLLPTGERANRVFVVGKPRTYETDDGSVNVSVRPESITTVDAATRDRWVAETAARTLDRIEAFDDEGNEYARMARDRYDLPVEEHRDAAVAALQSLDDADELEDGSEAPA